MATRDGRRAQIREAKRRLDERRALEAEPVSRGRPERLELCRTRLVEDWRTERRANRDYEAYRARGVMRDGRRFGAPPNPYEPPAKPEGSINVVDPDSRKMKGTRGFLQGYNAQAVTTEQQIIVAAEIAPQVADFEQLRPMVGAARAELEAAGVKERPGVVLADMGYWSNGHIDAVREQGIAALVAPDAQTRAGPRRGRRGGPYDFMRRVLAGEAGSELYKRRQTMIEPVFAQIKVNRGVGRFKRRGRAAARSEWRQIAATHNLLKLHRHSLAAATA